MNVQITAQRMMQNGINPNDLKTVGQVENVVNQIEQPKVNVNPGMTSVKKADVLDMEGNKIPEGSQIMGGKEVPTSIDQESFLQRVKKAVDEDREIKARLDADNEKGIASMKNKLDESEGTYSFGFKKGKEFQLNASSMGKGSLKEIVDSGELVGDDLDFAINILRDRKAEGGRIGLLAGSVPKVLKFLKSKKKIDEAVNNIFPTGDYKYDAQMAADSLVENNPQIFGGKLYEDLDMDTQMEVYGAVVGPIQSNALAVSRMKKATRPEKTLQSMKEGKGINMSDPDIAEEFARFMKETDPKGTKELEQKLELENFKTKDRSENADGGRIGLKAGMTKRAFLKLMGAGVAGVGAVKSGLFSIGKGATKQAAKEVAQQTTSGTPPAYFFKLAEKIKKLGDDVTAKSATLDRQKVTKYKDFELTEDVTTGEQTIQRMKVLDDDSASFYGNPLTEETYMNYKPSEKILLDETNPGGGVRKTLPEYEEGTALLRSDREYAGEIVDESFEISDDVLEEVGEAKSIKYASGGLAYMLGE